MSTLPNLMVALNGARKGKADHPALPITIPEVIAEAKACYAAGADGLHLHLRDADGRHLLDAGLYREALGEMQIAVPDMACQITTEAVGMYSPAQQRAIVAAVQPRLVSVSLAEMLEGGDVDAAAEFYQNCAATDISVQHILYGAEDLRQMASMLDKGHIPENGLQLLFVLGRYSDNQQSSPEDLDPFTAWHRDNGVRADWGICAFGLQETQCLQAAHQQGGKLRVGFENSFWNADGSMAASNHERVAEVKALVHR